MIYLKKLKILKSCCFFFSYSQIEFKIFFFKSFSSLLSLQLQSNKIKKLDKCLNYLKNLQVLRLDKNNLTSIHQAEIVSCSNLIHLNISENEISSLMVRPIIKTVCPFVTFLFYLVYQLFTKFGRANCKSYEIDNLRF